MKETIKKIIIDELEKKQTLPKNIIIDEYRFLDVGHIDSLGTMKFIVSIEDNFDIELSQVDIVSEEFRTIGGLVSMVHRLLQKNINNKSN
jgi:D-alanine--poly(phosphoribitol) ligase subunit 2